MDAQLATERPIIFAVLTTENRRQALVRSVIDEDVVGDNKGAEAADTALEMVAVARRAADRAEPPRWRSVGPIHGVPLRRRPRRPGTWRR